MLPLNPREQIIFSGTVSVHHGPGGAVSAHLGRQQRLSVSAQVPPASGTGHDAEGDWLDLRINEPFLLFFCHDRVVLFNVVIITIPGLMNAFAFGLNTSSSVFRM